MKTKNKNPEMVEIFNLRGDIFKCKVCGNLWYSKIKRGGRFYRIWQCPHGCKEVMK